MRTATNLLLVISDAKYEKVDLNKVMVIRCQRLTMTQRNELLKLLQEFEEFFNGTLGTWKTDPVDSKLKEYVNPIFLRPYPVPKVHEEFFKNEVGCLILLVVLVVENDSE